MFLRLFPPPSAASQPFMTIINRRLSIVSLFLLLSLFPVFLKAAFVSLDSIELYETHEFLGLQPTIYFQCDGESRKTLADLKEKGFLYKFKGDEPWQPLSDLHKDKCKSCGFYDTIKPHDVSDEWQFCYSDFTNADGKINHFKDKMLNATFLCPACISSEVGGSGTQNVKVKHYASVVVITALVSIILVLAVVAAFKIWQKKKRQQEQARFLRLFEDDEDIEEALGIGPLRHVV